MKFRVAVALVLISLAFSAHAQVGIQSSAIANNGSTATVLNQLVIPTGAPSTATVALTSSTDGVIGICEGQCGTTGSPLLAKAGVALCAFDATSAVAGDWVVASTTTGGDCHDTGSTTRPTGSQAIGRVLASGAGNNNYNVDLALNFTNSSVSNPVTVAQGGTGASTLTAHGLVVGEGTGAVAATGPTADSVPVWGSASSDPSTAGTSSTADSVLGWGAAGSTPAPEALTSCSGASSAVTYNTSTHAWGCNTISGGGITPNPAYIASNWYLPWEPNWTTFANSGAMSTTSIYCSPGVVWQTIHVNQMTFHIGTGGSSNVQLAIYNNGTNGYPSTLVINTGNMANTSTGQPTTGTFTSTSLTAGQYWFCNMTNDATMVAYVNGGGASPMAAFTMGDPAVTPGFFANSSDQVGYVYTGQTFGTWPNLSSTTPAADFAHSLAIAFKVASVP